MKYRRLTDTVFLLSCLDSENHCRHDRLDDTEETTDRIESSRLLQASCKIYTIITFFSDEFGPEKKKGGVAKPAPPVVIVL